MTVTGTGKVGTGTVRYDGTDGGTVMVDGYRSESVRYGTSKAGWMVQFSLEEVRLVTVRYGDGTVTV